MNVLIKALLLIGFPLFLSYTNDYEDNNLYSGGNLPQILVTTKILGLQSTDINKEDYDRAYKYVSRKTGIPASVIYMLHMFETRRGKSQLWRKHKNGFGIKGNSLGRDYVVYYNDDCGNEKCGFAAYNSIDTAFEDLIRLLNKVYKPCKNLEASDCIKCLKQIGYHTDNSVPDRIKIANEYKNNSV